MITTVRGNCRGVAGSPQVERPSAIGALLQLCDCLDLMETRFAFELSEAFKSFRKKYEEHGFDQKPGLHSRAVSTRELS